MTARRSSNFNPLMYISGWGCLFRPSSFWKSGLQEANTTLWASTCWPSSQTRVTSLKSRSSLSFPNAPLIFSWNSFHWRQSFSDILQGWLRNTNTILSYSINHLMHLCHGGIFFVVVLQWWALCFGNMSMYYTILIFSSMGHDFQCFEETHSVLVTHKGIMGVLCLGKPSHPHLPIILTHNKKSTKLDISKNCQKQEWKCFWCCYLSGFRLVHHSGQQLFPWYPKCGYCWNGACWSPFWGADSVIPSVVIAQVGLIGDVQ